MKANPSPSVFSSHTAVLKEEMIVEQGSRPSIHMHVEQARNGGSGYRGCQSKEKRESADFRVRFRGPVAANARL